MTWVSDGHARYWSAASLGADFPGFWMEAPLLGAAGFDYHVSYDRPGLHPGDRFAPGADFGCQGLVDWFANDETGGVGLGFAHDLRSQSHDDAVHVPAVYVNTNHNPLHSDAAFFRAAGYPELAPVVADLLRRLPAGYRTWYLGVFKNREGCPARIGCFSPDAVRDACAKDPMSFLAELRDIGFDAFDHTMARQLCELAQAPLSWEIQFDIYSDGEVGNVLSLDLCLPLAKTTRVAEFFAKDGLGARAMRVIEGWDVADERWRHIPKACFARLAWPHEGEVAFLLHCYPAFLKVKWQAGIPQPGKVYLDGVARPVG